MIREPSPCWQDLLSAVRRVTGRLPEPVGPGKACGSQDSPLSSDKHHVNVNSMLVVDSQDWAAAACPILGCLVEEQGGRRASGDVAKVERALQNACVVSNSESGKC